MFEDYRYIIILTTEIPFINFNEVSETSYETLRFSVNGSKTFVKWVFPNTPTFIDNFSTIEGPYTRDEFLVILSTSEWEEEPSI